MRCGPGRRLLGEGHGPRIERRDDQGPPSSWGFQWDNTGGRTTNRTTTKEGQDVPRPFTASQLGARLRRLGIEPQAARRGALIHLAATLPAAVLARAPNLTPLTAVRWVKAAGGDWDNYAAELMHSGDRGV